MKWIFAAATLLLATQSALAAQNTALCVNTNDGHETGTTSYSGARDANNCLPISPGDGGAPIKFQYTFLNRTLAIPGDCSTFDIKVGSGAGSTDPDKTILWDHVTWDGYNSSAGTQANPGTSCIEHDPIFTGKSDNKYSFQYWLFRHVLITNYVDCGQSSTFGPPGNRSLFSCDSDSAHHADSIQFQGQPTDDGWIVLQDSQFLNAIHTVRVQANPFNTSLGSISYQGVTIGSLQSSGLADHWIQDCLNSHDDNADHLCTGPEWAMGNALDHVWLINIDGTSTTDATSASEIVVVNQNCGPTGCNQGSITYHNGWPHPLSSAQTSLHPSSCPNGLIRNSPPTYCYTSIEAALADGRTMPPFTKLSCSGWATPPVECGGGGLPPALGIITSVTTPVTVGNAHTITATPSGGNGAYTVNFDCDADGQYDDGTDTTAPYTLVCPAINVAGNYEVGAKVTDNVAATATDSATLTVEAASSCGDGIIDAGEVCDPNGAGADNVSGKHCTDAQFGYSGGTLLCKADCSDYLLTSCTGPPVVSCGDHLCNGTETATSCYEDCESTYVSVIYEGVDGWYYQPQVLTNGAVFDRATPVSQHMNLIAEPVFGATSAYRFVFDSNDNSPYSVLQNSPLYSMCGDTGSTIDTSLPCSPPLPRGTHTIAVTACNQDFSGTFNVPPYTDARCTGGGGKLGPTQTFTFHIVYSQVVRNFLRDSVRHGMGQALIHLAWEAP